MLTSKGRKIAGRAGGESTTGANYAFGALEDEIIIKHRLLTRATTTRGDPPFKKLQKKFTSLYSEIENDHATNNDEEEEEEEETTTGAAAARLARAFLQELSTFEIPLLKARASIEANLREKEHFVDLNGEIGGLISRAKSDIEGLKLLLEESRVERRHKEECESVRRLVAAQPPRARTQGAIEELEEEIAALDAEDAAGVRTLELRKKQFALLLHVVDELQSAVEDDGRSVAAAAATVVHESGGGGGEEDAMVVD